jgi:preprotein translocase subunit SecA
VVNKQREVVYAQRRELLDKEDLRDEYIKVLEESLDKVMDEFADLDDEDMDVEVLYRRLFTVFPVPEHITPETMEGKTLDELDDMLTEAIHEAYDKKTAEIGPELMHRAERMVMINAIDQHWRRHLTDLDVLREGIGLVAMAQRDPLVEYKRAGFAMWQEMQDQIRAQAARDIFRVQINAPQVQVQRRPMPQLQAVRPGATQTTKAEPVRKNTKEAMGRNDPCWCGSGKKYKHCHYREDRKVE